jgi:AcrR family transcriptional regulator
MREMTGSQFLCEVISMANIEEKKTIKRNKIIDAASALFLDKSFASTAVDDVVKMAGVAKGTFYLYFKDKYDLLDQIVAHKTAEMFGEGVRRLRETPGSERFTLNGKILYMAEYTEDYLAEHRELAALLSRNLSNCFRRFVSGDSDELNAVVSVFTQAFTAEGYTEDMAKKIIYLITETVGSVCCEAVMGTGPFTLEEIRPALNKAVSNILEAKTDD